MKVVIVDDEPLAREGLRLLLAGHPDLSVVGEAGSGEAALAVIAATAPDLVLVDIQMPGMNGVDMALRIDTRPRPALVFVTAHDEFALRAFDLQALDYVLKPVEEARLAVAIDRARNERRMAGVVEIAERLRAALESIESPRLAVHVEPEPDLVAETDRLAIREGQGWIRLAWEEIDWVEAADYYVEIHVGPRSYLHRETLAQLEQRMDPGRFVRIHRSRLVNRDRVRELRSHGARDLAVVLHDGRVLEVARRSQARVRSALLGQRAER